MPFFHVVIFIAIAKYHVERPTLNSYQKKDYISELGKKDIIYNMVKPQRRKSLV